MMVSFRNPLESFHSDKDSLPSSSSSSSLRSDSRRLSLEASLFFSRRAKIAVDPIERVLDMDHCLDFLERLGPDASSAVLMRLDDPADLVRVCALSRSWRQFVISYGFCKKLCLIMCPELCHFSRVIELSRVVGSIDAGSTSDIEWESLKKEHGLYTYLIRCLVSPKAKRDCTIRSICASSTDNYPDESIDNTLKPGDRVNMRPSYWSSKGESDPGVAETLTYRFDSKLCIIEEIRIQPFRAYFQLGCPIYSAKTVQFRFGLSRSSQAKRSNNSEYAANKVSHDDYFWTYVSPEYPMSQENSLQSFKLPRPVVCIGGILQIELLGRVQKQDVDDLYYICVCHVQVIGRPLAPVFDVDILDANGNLSLMYYSDARDLSTPPEGESLEVRRSAGWHFFAAKLKQMGPHRVRSWNRNNARN